MSEKAEILRGIVKEFRKIKNRSKEDAANEQEGAPS
jgi:hypothetical protein